jgi:hypothetical protein
VKRHRCHYCRTRTRRGRFEWVYNVSTSWMAFICHKCLDRSAVDAAQEDDESDGFSDDPEDVPVLEASELFS